MSLRVCVSLCACMHNWSCFFWLHSMILWLLCGSDTVAMMCQTMVVVSDTDRLVHNVVLARGTPECGIFLCVVVAVACVCSVAILYYFIRNMDWDWVHDDNGLGHTLFVPSVRSSVRPSVLFVRWLFCCACLTRNISTQTYVCTDTQHTRNT